MLTDLFAFMAMWFKGGNNFTSPMVWKTQSGYVGEEWHSQQKYLIIIKPLKRKYSKFSEGKIEKERFVLSKVNVHWRIGLPGFVLGENLPWTETTKKPGFWLFSQFYSSFSTMKSISKTNHKRNGTPASQKLIPIGKPQSVDMVLFLCQCHLRRTDYSTVLSTLRIFLGSSFCGYFLPCVTISAGCRGIGLATASGSPEYSRVELYVLGWNSWF